MAVSDSDLLSAVLSLPAEKRAHLAQELIRSLDETSADADTADAWIAEIEKRSREVSAGTAELEDWTALRERLANRWPKR